MVESAVRRLGGVPPCHAGERGGRGGATVRPKQDRRSAVPRLQPSPGGLLHGHLPRHTGRCGRLHAGRVPGKDVLGRNTP